jgi:hypothetical protein
MVDLVLEVRDARIPFSTCHPQVGERACDFVCTVHRMFITGCLECRVCTGSLLLAQASPLSTYTVGSTGSLAVQLMYLSKTCPPCWVRQEL